MNVNDSGIWKVLTNSSNVVPKETKSDDHSERVETM